MATVMQGGNSSGERGTVVAPLGWRGRGKVVAFGRRFRTRVGSLRG